VGRPHPTKDINSIEQLKEAYVSKYMDQKPWSEYINGVGISKVGLQLELQKGYTPRNDGTLDNLCLSVTLRREIPDDLRLPEKFQEVSVYYKVVGEIVPYCCIKKETL